MYVDPGLLAGSDRRMGKFLVEVDMFDGLLLDIELEWRGVSFVQKLEFQGMSFWCSTCKATGHLKIKCAGFYKKLQNEMLVDYSYETCGNQVPELIQPPGLKFGNKLQKDKVCEIISDVRNSSAEREICPDKGSTHIQVI